jgi:GntR family phosphonate transport system transcriptional regulator
MSRDALPVYVQIAEELRQHIHQGVYQVGDKLPTELQLAERFDVNRHTLRQAIALLKQEGLLRVDQGRGTFVAAQTIRYPIGERVRYNEALKASGRAARFRILRATEISADAAIAEALELQIGDPVALIDRLSFADGQPISIGSGYFPLTLLPNLLQHTDSMQSVSELLRQVYGCDHLRRSTRISARLVKPQDARWLELPLNQPILYAESINVDQHGRVIEYGITRFRGDRMELVVENDLHSFLGKPEKT